MANHITPNLIQVIDFQDDQVQVILESHYSPDGCKSEQNAVFVNEVVGCIQKKSLIFNLESLKNDELKVEVKNENDDPYPYYNANLPIRVEDTEIKPEIEWKKANYKLSSICFDELLDQENENDTKPDVTNDNECNERRNISDFKLKEEEIEIKKEENQPHLHNSVTLISMKDENNIEVKVEVKNEDDLLPFHTPISILETQRNYQEIYVNAVEIKKEEDVMLSLFPYLEDAANVKSEEGVKIEDDDQYPLYGKGNKKKPENNNHSGNAPKSCEKLSLSQHIYIQRILKETRKIINSSKKTLQETERLINDDYLPIIESEYCSTDLEEPQISSIELQSILQLINQEKSFSDDHTVNNVDSQNISSSISNRGIPEDDEQSPDQRELRNNEEDDSDSCNWEDDLLVTLDDSMDFSEDNSFNHSFLVDNSTNRRVDANNNELNESEMLFNPMEMEDEELDETGFAEMKHIFEDQGVAEQVEIEYEEHDYSDMMDA